MTKTKTKEFELPATLHIDREYKIGGEVVFEEQSDSTISVHVFVTEPAFVSRRKSLTMQPKKYHSATTGVEVRIPCYMEQVPEAIKALEELVEKTLADDMKSTLRWFESNPDHSQR